MLDWKHDSLWVQQVLVSPGRPLDPVRKQQEGSQLLPVPCSSEIHTAGATRSPLLHVAAMAAAVFSHVILTATP